MNYLATFKAASSVVVIAVFLALCGCSTDRDRLAEFNIVFDQAMLELFSLMKDAEVINEQGHTQKSSYFIGKCDSVSSKIREMALVMQERANAIHDEEAREISRSIASDFKEAGLLARELGTSYGKEFQALRGVVNPEDNIMRYFKDSILKLAGLSGLIERIETSHNSLESVVAQKYGERKP